MTSHHNRVSSESSSDPIRAEALQGMAHLALLSLQIWAQNNQDGDPRHEKREA